VGHCVEAAVDIDCDTRCRRVAEADVADCMAEIGDDQDIAICREVGQIAYDSCMNDCR